MGAKDEATGVPVWPWVTEDVLGWRTAEALGGAALRQGRPEMCRGDYEKFARGSWKTECSQPP